MRHRKGSSEKEEEAKSTVEQQQQTITTTTATTEKKKPLLSSLSSINQLPAELLIHIFQLLVIMTDTPASLDILVRVNRSWRSIATCEALWQFIGKKFVPGLPLLRLVSSLNASPNTTANYNNQNNNNSVRRNFSSSLISQQQIQEQEQDQEEHSVLQREKEEEETTTNSNSNSNSNSGTNNNTTTRLPRNSSTGSNLANDSFAFLMNSEFQREDLMVPRNQRRSQHHNPQSFSSIADKFQRRNNQQEHFSSSDENDNNNDESEVENKDVGDDVNFNRNFSVASATRETRAASTFSSSSPQNENNNNDNDNNSINSNNNNINSSPTTPKIRKENNNKNRNNINNKPPISLLLSRDLVTSIHNEQVRHIVQFHKFVLVEHQRRYTVNLFVTFMLLALTACSICFVAALELTGNGRQDMRDEMILESIKNSESPFTKYLREKVFSVDSAFHLLWISLTLGCCSIVTNIIMTAHYNPKPLMQRVIGNWELISLSVIILGVIVAVMMFPLYAIQQNVSSCWGKVGMWSELGCLHFRWITGCLPIVAALVGWQILVIFKSPDMRELVMFDENANTNIDLNDNDDDLNENENNNNDSSSPSSSFSVFSSSAWYKKMMKHVAITLSHLTPLTLAVGVLTFALYLETGRTYLLAIAAFPFLVCMFVLMGLFFMDFTVGGAVTDGIALFSLFLVSISPVTAVFFPIRGLTGLPIIFALGSTFVGYAKHTWVLIKSVDDLGSI